MRDGEAIMSQYTADQTWMARWPSRRITGIDAATIFSQDKGARGHKPLQLEAD